MMCASVCVCVCVREFVCEFVCAYMRSLHAFDLNHFWLLLKIKFMVLDGQHEMSYGSCYT